MAAFIGSGRLTLRFVSMVMALKESLCSSSYCISRQRKVNVVSVNDGVALLPDGPGLDWQDTKNTSSSGRHFINLSYNVLGQKSFNKKSPSFGGAFRYSA